MKERDIFDAALAIADPEKRNAFLAAACAGDTRLEEHMRGLLAAEQGLGSFLEEPAVAATLTMAPPQVAEGVGTVIGPYKLLEPIGEGGMGVVYMAEQTQPVRRKVALKVIKPGMDTTAVVARFEAERQALALMDHPHIAKVHDAGATDTGRPFFVMELVRGVPITDYCDQARLTPRRRLEVFLPVCAAVQHAHQKGIIHRDLKPSNVLVAEVDGKPVPKVIDFGVAKAVDPRLSGRTLFTRHGAIVGTAEYMSPEQAGASPDVDTRTDVYGLGVLLYELLTGTTPLDRKALRQAAFDEVLRHVREEEPPKPSTRLSATNDRLPSVAAVRGTEPARLSRLVRGDLDWVVMKALDKDRTRRYETPSAFARDIQRYLDADPVEAGPPSRAYRLRKFARKHRAALSTAAAVGLLLVVATAVSTWEAWRATRAERVAESRLSDTRKAQAATKEALKQSEEAQARAEAVSAFLTEAFRSPDPSQNGRQVKVADMLDRAVEKLDTDFTVSPATRGALLNSLGLTYSGLGLYDKAIETHGKARVLRETSLGPGHPDTLVSRTNLADAYRVVGRYADAIALHEATLKLKQSALGPDHPVTLTSRNNLALAYLAAGRTDEAVALHEGTLSLREARFGPDHPDTVSSRTNLAEAYHAAGRYGDAIALLERAIEWQDSALGPDHPNTIISRLNLAAAYADAGRTAEADPLLERAVRQADSKLGPDHPHTLSGRNLLANAYRAAGRTAEAIALHEAVLKLRETNLGSDHPDTLTSRKNLANAYLNAGRTDEAIALLEATLKLREAVLGPDHPQTLSSRNSLAAGYWRLARLDRSIPLFERTLKQQAVRLGPDHPDSLRTQANLGVNYKDAGRPLEGARLMEEALRRAQGRPDARAALAWVPLQLAAAYDASGQFARSEPLYRGGLAQARKTFGSDDPRTGAALTILGNNLLQQGKWSEAEPVLRESLAIRQKLEPDAWNTFNTRSLLGGALLARGRYTEAELLVVSGYEEMKARETTIPPPARPRLPEAAVRVVRLYEAWGKPEQAAAWKAKLGLEDLPADVFAPP
jgi:serine/threonine protein kinase